MTLVIFSFCRNGKLYILYALIFLSPQKRERESAWKTILVVLFFCFISGCEMDAQRDLTEWAECTGLNVVIINATDGAKKIVQASVINTILIFSIFRTQNFFSSMSIIISIHAFSLVNPAKKSFVERKSSLTPKRYVIKAGTKNFQCHYLAISLNCIEPRASRVFMQCILKLLLRVFLVVLQVVVVVLVYVRVVCVCVHSRLTGGVTQCCQNNFCFLVC